jgi:hypothetical protein
MKSTIICDITPYSPFKINRSFGRTYRLHLQDRISRARSQAELWLPPAFMLVSCSAYSSTLKMEAMFLRNVGWLSNGLHGVISQKIVVLAITIVELWRASCLFCPGYSQNKYFPPKNDKKNPSLERSDMTYFKVIIYKDWVTRPKFWVKRDCTPVRSDSNWRGIYLEYNFNSFCEKTQVSWTYSNWLFILVTSYINTLSDRQLQISRLFNIYYTPSTTWTTVRHRQLVSNTVTSSLKITKFYFQQQLLDSISTYFLYTYARGKLEQTYTRFLFRKVAYKRYDVYSFVE